MSSDRKHCWTGSIQMNKRELRGLSAYRNYILLSADLTESAQVEKPTATLATQSQSSTSGSGSLNPSSGPPGSSASTVPVSPVLQSPAPPILQDPTLLRQLLPALQTALQLNNASVDMAKINEGKTNAHLKYKWFNVHSCGVYSQSAAVILFDEQLL